MWQLLLLPSVGFREQGHQQLQLPGSSAVLYLVAKQCVTLCDPWTIAHQIPLAMGSSKQEYRGGLPCPPPGIFPTQGSNPGLPHCKGIL